MNNFVKYQLPIIVWALAIFIASSIPTLPHIIDTEFGIDKVVHAIMYYIFCWLTHRALNHQNKFPFLRKYSYIAALLLTAVYGYLDEVHQLYVVGRSYDIYDWTADSFGALLYVCIAYLRSRKVYSVSASSKAVSNNI